VGIRFLLNEFGGHVKRCAFDAGEYEGIAAHASGESEIAQLDATIGAYENVLRLHIAVNDSVLVEILQRMNELCGNPLDFSLRQLAVIFEDFKELSMSIFRHHAKLGFGLEVFDHLDDVGVRKVGQDPDLLPKAFQVLFRLAVLWNELHGHRFGRTLAPTLEDLPKGALAYLFQHVIVLHAARVLMMAI
jgi:hypothetical protein